MEASGAVTELDLLVCRQVCRFLAERIAKGLPVARTSVNLSRLHTQNPDVADAFHGIVSQYSLSPELIQFELTETIFLNDFSGAKKIDRQAALLRIQRRHRRFRLRLCGDQYLAGIGFRRT